MSKTSLTIINDRQLRGVLAPAHSVSKEVLEDIIDLIEWSSPKAVKESERRIREADRKNSWIPLEKVYRHAKQKR